MKLYISQTDIVFEEGRVIQELTGNYIHYWFSMEMMDSPINLLHKPKVSSAIHLQKEELAKLTTGIISVKHNGDYCTKPTLKNVYSILVSDIKNDQDKVLSKHDNFQALLVNVIPSRISGDYLEFKIYFLPKG